MDTLSELKAQRAKIDAQIEELNRQHRTDAVKTIHQLIQEFDLTAPDIFETVSPSAKRKPGPKVTAKYRDPDSGKEWSGRGLQPRWLANKNKADFLFSRASN